MLDIKAGVFDSGFYFWVKLYKNLNLLRFIFISCNPLKDHLFIYYFYFF